MSLLRPSYLLHLEPLSCWPPLPCAAPTPTVSSRFTRTPMRAVPPQTLDDIPSSLEGYELPGLHDDDNEELEGHDDDRGYGGFAAEFSAGSVF